MNKQIIQYPKGRGDFHLPLAGTEPTRRGVIDVLSGFLVTKENDIAQTAFGTNLKILFFRIIKRTQVELCNFIARIQLGDKKARFIRSESGQWLCHPDYIQETIEREKMRNYELRRG